MRSFQNLLKKSHLKNPTGCGEREEHRQVIGMKKYHVAGYVKLAKLWEKTADRAVPYHHRYYQEKYQDDPQMELVDIYIDITGQKNIKRRKEMLRLISDCMAGRVDCIATQTRAYLAADNEEFFFLIHLLFGLDPPVQIVTEDDDYTFDTIANTDHQREALAATAADYVKMDPSKYDTWKKEIIKAIAKQVQDDR